MSDPNESSTTTPSGRARKRADALDAVQQTYATLAELSAQLSEIAADGFFVGEHLPAAIEHCARAMRYLSHVSARGEIRETLAALLHQASERCDLRPAGGPLAPVEPGAEPVEVRGAVEALERERDEEPAS